MVVCAELYGFSGNIRQIKEICEKHGALLIEDAAEAMGATWEGQQCGSFGDYAAVSYNGNKIITGSSGGCLLTNDLEVANKARKWSTQARENPLWINEFPKREPVPGRVIAVGRLADQKNYEGMIKAFALVVHKINNAKLYIYGGGECESYKKLAESLGIKDNVIFAGMTKDIIKEHQTAEVYVMFSHGGGYPNALMEALAMGVPSISSDCPVGGPRDMIDDGINGYLVKCGDEKAFSERIIELLGNDQLKTKFSEAAISIRDTNQFDVIYRRYMDYIVNCINK